MVASECHGSSSPRAVHDVEITGSEYGTRGTLDPPHWPGPSTTNSALPPLHLDGIPPSGYVPAASGASASD